MEILQGFCFIGNCAGMQFVHAYIIHVIIYIYKYILKAWWPEHGFQGGIKSVQGDQNGPREFPKEPRKVPRVLIEVSKKPIQGSRCSMKSQQVSVANLDEPVTVAMRPQRVST